MASGFRKKLNKLKRDPYRFFADSPLGRLLIKKVPVGAPAGAPEKKSATPAQVVEPPSEFADIGLDGQISFRSAGKGKRGTKAALLLARGNEGFYRKYLAQQAAGFSPLELPALDIGYFHPNLGSHGGELGLINRIAQKEKQVLGDNETVFLVDAPALLANVLGACDPRLKVYSVLTRPELLDGLDYRMVAGVVLVGFDTEMTLGTRVLKCRDLNEVHQHFRRLIQDGAPKTPNMLLPIRGGQSGFAGIESFDTARFGGVAFCRPTPAVKGRKFNAYLEAFDRDVVDLYLTESVYLGYKSLCEVIESGGSASAFFAKALADGVVFDVRLMEEKQ